MEFQSQNVSFKASHGPPEEEILKTFGPAGAMEIIRNNLFITVFAWMAHAFGLVGNASVLHVIINTPNMRATNKFIASLAATDLARNVNAVGRFIYYYLISTDMNTLLGKLGTYITAMLVTVLNLTLVAISIERCFMLRNPLTKISSKYYIAANAFIWLCSSLQNFPFVFVSELKPDSTGITNAICVERWESVKLNKAFGVLVFICGMATVSTIIICYVLIWIEVRNRKKPGEELDHTHKKNVRVTKMVSVIIIAHFVSMFPIYLVYSLESKSEEFREEHSEAIYYLQVVAMCVLALHPCMNPVIYWFMNKKFRERFKTIFRRD